MLDPSRGSIYECHNLLPSRRQRRGIADNGHLPSPRELVQASCANIGPTGTGSHFTGPLSEPTKKSPSGGCECRGSDLTISVDVFMQCAVRTFALSRLVKRRAAVPTVLLSTYQEPVCTMLMRSDEKRKVAAWSVNLPGVSTVREHCLPRHHRGLSRTQNTAP